MGRKLLAAAILVLALGVTARAQTTTTTVTTTTTLAAAAPTEDGYFIYATANRILPTNRGEMLVYVDTRGGDVTVTMPNADCGCKVGIAKLYDDHLLHIQVLNPASEGLAPPPFVRVTSFDVDKASGPMIFTSNPPPKTWFLGF